MIKDPAIACDLDSSLLPLPNSPDGMAFTRNSSTFEDFDAPKINFEKVKSAYYKFIQKKGHSSQLGSQKEEK